MRSTSVCTCYAKQLLHGNGDLTAKISIAKNKIYQDALIVDIADELKDNTDMLDIGAHIGLVSIGVDMIRQTKDNTFHCIEPYIENLTHLKNNIGTKDNFFTYHCALGSYIHFDNLNSNPYGIGESYIARIWEDGDKHIFIPTINLDYISNKFPRVNVVKIGCPKSVRDILSGGTKFLMKYKPVVYIYRDDDQIEFKINVNLLETVGYKFSKFLSYEYAKFIHTGSEEYPCETTDSKFQRNISKQ